jgi:hypothetical protein
MNKWVVRFPSREILESFLEKGFLVARKHARYDPLGVGVSIDVIVIEDVETAIPFAYYVPFPDRWGRGPGLRIGMFASGVDVKDAPFNDEDLALSGNLP